MSLIPKMNFGIDPEENGITNCGRRSSSSPTSAFRSTEMEFENTDRASANPLLMAVTGEFLRGIKMISAVDDPVYQRSANGTGSIGGHFRHNLDFVTVFLNGITTRQINYNLRERNLRVENDRTYAIKRIEFAIRRLESLTDEILGCLVFVRSEVDTSSWLRSSVLRELEFLHSHTVHHHALIAEKLAGLGVTITKDFGAAPSTLEYWKQKAA